MGLETATYISGLVASNPINATDIVGEGDDHIRLIKLTLLNTFPNITGAMTLTQIQLNDAAIKSENNVFLGQNQILQHLTPTLRWDETDAGTNEKEWDMRASGGQLRMRTLTDASGAGEEFLKVIRTGTVVDEIELNATLIDINSGVDITGNLQVNGSDAYLILNETNGGVDEKVWHMRAAADELWLGSATDAAPTTFANSWCRVQRSGTSFPQITFSATELQFDGTTFDINGALDVSGASVFAQSGVGTSSAVRLESAQPTLTLRETDQALDEEAWGIVATGAQLSIRVYKDDYSSSSQFFRVLRTGITVDEIELNATLCDLNGNLDVSGTFTMAGATADFGSAAVTTDNDTSDEVGFKGVPQSTKDSAYTLVLTDSGRSFLHTSATPHTWTIPANASVAFPVGTVVNFVNDGTGAVTIAITTDTLRWAGVGTTGSRTLAQFGMATAKKVSSTAWYISGTGLS